MTRNTRKILSLIIFLTLIILSTSYYFFFFKKSHNSTNKKAISVEKELARNDAWIGEEYPEFEKLGPTKAKEYLISTSDKRASEIGAQILAKGGNAIDAAIAAQMVLNVVEPQSSGIGGGGFLVYYDAKTKQTHFFNGRETAPKNANSEIFLDANKQPRKFEDVIKGGLSVGTPSLLKMLKLVHERYGKLPWKDLFDSAIKIAKEGFVMDSKIYTIASNLSYLKESEGFAKIYLKADGKPKDLGSMITNPDLAKTFETIAQKGISPFYEGQIANDIVNKVRSSKVNPGYLSLEDLRDYKVVESNLICAPYRKFKVCSSPIPSSGGVGVLQILGILENFDLPDYHPLDVKTIHLILEASKLAYADRNQYVADIPNVPVDKMLDKNYLKSRSDLIKTDRAALSVVPGQFDLPPSNSVININAMEKPSTTHLSIIDKEGNAVSFTSSVEYLFGSSLVVNGFILNNQLTDFSFLPVINGKDVANKLMPGKQPRSSMAPTFVFDENNNLILVVGSPGGPRIIQYVVKTIIGVLDWNLSIENAVNMPNFVAISDGVELEKGTDLEKLAPELTKMGHKIAIKKIDSGINAIFFDRKNNIMIGSADFRRNGAAVGK